MASSESGRPPLRNPQPTPPRSPGGKDSAQIEGGLLDVFDDVVRSDGDVEAFVEPTSAGVRRITFAELAAEADGVARALRRRGIGRGDVVAIALPSGIDYAIAYHGIVRAGAIATGINPRLGPTEAAHILNRCGPRLVIDGRPPSDGRGDPLGRHTDLGETDPVAIVWTGGTTGLPKGAWFDHGCLRAVAEGGAPISAPGDRRLSPLPFAHVGFMTRAWDELANRITTIVTPTPWTATAALELIEQQRVTVCQGVPAQYRAMLDLLDDPSSAQPDPSSLRIAATGGAPVPPDLPAAITARFGCPVVVRYASTESALATGTRSGDTHETISTTVGRPNQGVELRLDAAGEIELRSRARMRGYWDDTEQTTAAFTTDGWLRTGDLGSLDGAGNLRLAGRRTELYIRGGYNVYPVEVENCVGEHPAVAAAAVVGAAVDDRRGEIGVLFAVSRPGASVELDEIRDFVDDRLAHYKAPEALVVVDELPLTPIGKVDKEALRPRANREARRSTRVAT